MPTHRKVAEFTPEGRPGVVRKRYLISEMFDNQDYFLQIDSHTLFSPGWDTAIINQLNKAKEIFNTDKLVLTGTTEVLPGSGEQYSINKNIFKPIIEIVEDTFFAIDHKIDENAQVPDDEFREAKIISACMLFADKNFLTEVGLDSISHTYEEQPYLSFRTFMNGWKMYTPNKCYIIHSPFEYYHEMYGGDTSKRKFGTDYVLHLEWETDILKDINTAMLYNTGRYSIPNAVKTTKEWWQHLNLEDKFLSLVV